MENTININELPKINNGRLWYLVFLPILACYLENYAVNIYMGLFLWILVILIGPFVCVADEKHMRIFGINDPDLHRFRFIAPIYMYKRLKITGQSSTPFIMFMLFILYALLNNGFTDALTITDDTFTESIKSSYVSSIDEYDSLVTYETIEERISACADERNVDWTFTQDDDYRYVTASFKVDKQETSIVFRLDFDGYKLKSTDIKSVTVAGKELEGKDRESMLYQIFIQTIEKDDPQSYTDTSVSYKEA